MAQKKYYIKVRPTFGGEWNKSRSYEYWTTAYDPSTGNTYLSIRNVPANTELTDTTYWALFSQVDGRYASLVETATTAVNDAVSKAETATTAASNAATSANDAASAANKKTAEFETLVSDENTRATKAETDLSTKISAETTRAEAVEKANADAIASEATRAEKAEKSNSDAITAEAERAQEAESATDDKVTAINKSLGSADYSTLASTITEGLEILQNFKTSAEPITQKIEAYTKIPSAVAFNNRVDRNWDGLGVLVEHATDVTADFDNGTLSRKIAANDLSDYDLGMQIKKTITIDGTAYTAHIIFAHANAFYGYSNYAMVDTPNIACIVYVEGYTSKWNESNTDGGYTTSVLRTAVQKVISALQTTLGSDHMIAHNVLLSNAVSNGKSSSWAWAEGSRGEALSAAQMCGVNPSGSYFDTGEAYEQLALARLVRPNQIFGNIWLWFRDVLASWGAANLYGGGGFLGGSGVGATGRVVSLILLK